MKKYALLLSIGLLTLLSTSGAFANTPYQTWQASMHPAQQQCVEQYSYAMGLDYEDVLLLYFFRDYGVSYHHIPYLSPVDLFNMGVTEQQRNDTWAIGLDYEDLLC